jgi:hypothetical protein
MKKFNEWMTDRTLTEMDTPHNASVHYGRFLGQIMGWDSHGDPKTFGGRMANWMAGGRHRKAQEMGADIFRIIENPASIADVISRARKDGVYNSSTYYVCFEMVKKISGMYKGGSVPGTWDVGTPNFQAMLLHDILGKCHKSMSLEYVDAENFYHNVMGTNPAVKKILSAAYDKDPKDLKEWLAAAKTAKPHNSYDETDHTALYWRIESQGIISPLNLIKMLINKSPDKALGLPQNTKELNGYSIEFAEAYFPNIINKRKASAASAGSGGKPDVSKLSPQERFGDDLDSLINVLNHFQKNIKELPASAADNSVVTGGKKAKLVAALQNLIGPAPMAVAPDPGTPFAKLKDHTTFFGLQQIVESNKLD